MSGILSDVFGFGSGDAALTLQKLRGDPQRAAADYGFIVTGTGNYAGRADGGPCTIECEALGDGNYALHATGGAGRDFFFPFVSAGAMDGVGRCRVPAGQPDGTIVITGGMNGCSLDVRRINGNLVFMHDADGKALAKLPAMQGEPVCRVDARQYMPGSLQQNHAAARTQQLATPSAMTAAYPENYLISVRSGHRWIVVHSAMLRIQSDRGSREPRFERVRTVSSVMTSFAD